MLNLYLTFQLKLIFNKIPKTKSLKNKLFHITFESISECNLNCVYCYNHWKSNPSIKKQKYSHSKAIKTLKKLYSQADVELLTITGGEPLLNSFIGELVLTAKFNKSKVTVISNGSNRSTQDYSYFKNLGLDLFILPIHSDNAEIHDAMTKNIGSWKNSIESVMELMNRGISLVPNIVLTKINIAGIEKTIEFIHSLGLRRISINRYNLGGNGLLNNDILPEHIELQNAFKKINHLAAKMKLGITSNVCTPFCVLIPTDYPNIGFGSCGKDQFKRPTTIDIDGNVRICNHSPHTIGNIFKDDIFSIIESEKVKNWNANVPDFCNSCSLYDKCLGGCRAAAEQCGKDSNSVDPYVFGIT